MTETISVLDHIHLRCDGEEINEDTLDRIRNQISSMYSQFDWKTDEVVVQNFKTGETIFQRNIEYPVDWEYEDIKTTSSKYFADWEYSIKQMFFRVVGYLAYHGMETGDYFDNYEDMEEWIDDMIFNLVSQNFAFNSPVWFNVGKHEKQQGSACFILPLEDSLDGIAEFAQTEMTIFSRGSGSGANFSNLRGKGEPLSKGGTSSGAVSFIESTSAQAGAIKSGGATRRAAKMVVLDDDHPDIIEFIESKQKVEERLHILRKNGVDVSMNSETVMQASFQNANHSVGVSDGFMEAYRNGGEWETKGRINDDINETYSARMIMDKICEAGHACGDPAIQYYDTINHWHTCLEDGEIVSSNPCSEYFFLNNTSCNLGSLKLTNYFDGKRFDVDSFVSSIETLTLAMDMIVEFSVYPTDDIAEETRKYRTLGLGFTDLGGLLMSMGIPYDSGLGRLWASALNSLLTATAYGKSKDLAEKLGSFEAYDRNESHMYKVLTQHEKAHIYFFEDEDFRTSINPSKSLRIQPEAFKKLRIRQALGSGDSRLYNIDTIIDMGGERWKDTLSSQHGYRNAQVTVQAPTGTISFLMGATTTGIEVDFSLIKFKSFVGGEGRTIINPLVEIGLERAGFNDHESAKIVSALAHRDGDGKSKPLPLPEEFVDDERIRVLQCAMDQFGGTLPALSSEGHILMLGALQPFVSGGISKTVNLPHEADTDDFKRGYDLSYDLGVKSVAFYRDGSKATQALYVSGESDLEKEDNTEERGDKIMGTRKDLPPVRPSMTFSSRLNNMKMHNTLGYHPDTGEIGELFIHIGKQGTFAKGVTEALGRVSSLYLREGGNVNKLIEQFRDMDFDPKGWIEGYESSNGIKTASSIVDLLGIIIDENRRIDTGNHSVHIHEGDDKKRVVNPTSNGNVCTKCGSSNMVRNSSNCYSCKNCGFDDGCSV